tara:strand:- start:1006 stop:1932 length:927 start_codon:yes stop_codon:yes gene_type:complete
MIKNFWFILLILVLICHKSYSKNNIFIIANINNEILTNHDVQQEIEYLKIINPQLRQLNYKKNFQIAKDSLIKETIKKIELKKYYILDEEQPIINELFQNFFKKLGFSNENEFQKVLSSKNTYSNSQIQKKMKIEFYWNRIILEKYEDQVKINKNNLIKKISQINEYKSEYLLSEIFFYKEKSLKLEDQINMIKSSINEVGFNNTASIYSKSESANLGGKIGWVEEENLSKKIIKELKKINKGEFTNVIQFGNNLLILKIEDKKTNKIKTDNDLTLKKMIQFEKNKQLNQFSNIYFNKIKVNYVINEK